MANQQTQVKPPYVIGPRGEKRPQSTTANAVHVARIALGLAEEEYVSEAKLKRAAKRRARR